MPVDDIERRAESSNDSTDLKPQRGSGGHSGRSPVFLKTIKFDWALSIASQVRVSKLARSLSVKQVASRYAGSNPAAHILKPTTRFCLRGPKCGISCAWTRLKVRALVRQWTRMEAWELRQAAWKPVKYPLFQVRTASKSQGRIWTHPAPLCEELM